VRRAASYGRRVANHKKTQRPRKPRKPLPKVGTPADDAYRLKHSRRDVVDFGVGGGRRGPLAWIIAVIVIGCLLLGVLGLVLFT
jgi:hypothetical protein